MIFINQSIFAAYSALFAMSDTALRMESGTSSVWKHAFAKIEHNCSLVRSRFVQ